MLTPTSPPEDMAANRPLELRSASVDQCFDSDLEAPPPFRTIFYESVQWRKQHAVQFLLIDLIYFLIHFVLYLTFFCF